MKTVICVLLVVNVFAMVSFTYKKRRDIAQYVLLENDPTLYLNNGVLDDNDNRPISEADVEQENEGSITNANDRIRNDPNLLKIMFWTTLYNHLVYLNGRDRFLECKMTTCTYVHDKQKYEEMDAILFHIRDINMTDLPPTRKPNQKWILYGRESPANARIKPELNRLFNATYTYRHDSDIPYPYGISIPTKRAILKENFATGKSGGIIAWIVSNCETQSRRDEYVRELQKHIPVDEYGRCSNRKCDNGDDCDMMIYHKYKFFIAFENSLCKGYVTEKPWKALMYNAVPIVLGHANYSDILPKDSFIDVRNFSSPAELADYINEVDQDDRLYNSYFRYQMDYRVMYTGVPHACTLCEYLHEHINDTKIYKRVDLWWNKCVSTQKFYKGVADMLL